MANQLEKQPINKIYPTLFRGHVASFLESLKFDLRTKRVIVSVSAGIDSITLLDVVHKLGLGSSLEILHFNHGTRPKENKLEEELIFNLSKKLNLKLHITRFNLDLKLSNFEHVARQKRHETYKKFINSGAIILCGHHINDSFEWSLMQSFKQSGLVTSLGIPVYNNGILRPFMCVSKDHILKYAQIEKLPWLDDSSNDDVRYERNKLRRNIASTVLRDYPKALKHYANRQNLLAKKLGVHATNKNETSSKLISISKDVLGRIVITSDHFFIHKDEIKKCIFDLSQTNRGLIDKELDKFLELQNNLMNDPKVLSVKGPFRGPINFSGGVSGYIYKDQILFLSNASLKLTEKLDENLLQKLKTSQITEPVALDTFPYIVINRSLGVSNTSKLIHPLLAKTCHWLKENNIGYTFDPSFFKNNQQNLISSALLLDSSNLGL